jgi:hypothetical protein
LKAIKGKQMTEQKKDVKDLTDLELATEITIRYDRLNQNSAELAMLKQEVAQRQQMVADEPCNRISKNTAEIQQNTGQTE